jgi:hypothetical protein
MDNDLKDKANILLKSLYKNIQKLKHKKDAIEDLFDSNTTAEINPDDIPTGKTSIMNKAKMQKKQGVPEEADPEVHERCVKKVKAKGHDKESAFAICNEAKAGQGDVKKTEEIINKISKNLNTIAKAYKDKMEKRCWEGYKPTPGKKPYSEGSCQPIKKEEKEKPFHGYNKEKHSKEGGLSAKAREKYNKEHGSNLQAPVSSKEAKKSPKKAARRKSFCARMSHTKGATSKDGKLTPKGAALKRWDC